jgi:glycosyltransferase involved in cell wall biosynthesis
MASDVLIVSLGSTSGLRAADAELRDSLLRAGASVELVSPAPLADVPTLMLTDLRWARAARDVARAGIKRSRPRALIYSSTTAALLWPRPGAIRFDAPASGNRRGRHGLWQRPLERLRLHQAPVLLPWSTGGLAELSASVGNFAEAKGEGNAEGDSKGKGKGKSKGGGRGKGKGGGSGEGVIVLPVPVKASGPSEGVRDIAAITYAANPLKKGLDRVLEAWQRVCRPGEELLVAGVHEPDLARAGLVVPDEGVRVTGLLAPEDYRALLRRARVFVCAPRREDYGVAQLEALADGCRLVSTPAPGPYAALPLARQLDPRLVREDLGGALRLALDEPMGDYPQRAQRALEPFSREFVDRIVAEELLPQLLAFSPAVS